ncbi:MAG: class I SAM-dependent methyltransferase [Bacteroidales bacterium]
MEKEELLENLNILAQKTNDQWMKGLEKRKIKELEFHNRDRDVKFQEKISKDTYDKIYGNRKFYKTVELSTKYVDNWIKKNAEGKVFLDYACGNGFNAIKAAKANAMLSIGIDISNISVENAKNTAKENKVESNTFFVQGDAERTGLPDNSIDVVICSGMLHHLDLSYAFYELRRILKPGGKILAVEALDYNPFIKLYRLTTPDMRTEWEKAHILSYKDIKFAKSFFIVKTIKHWHLFSIMGVYLPSLLSFFNLLDKIILKIPLINKMSWMFTFELHKND